MKEETLVQVSILLTPLFASLDTEPLDIKIQLYIQPTKDHDSRIPPTLYLLARGELSQGRRLRETASCHPVEGVQEGLRNRW